MHASVRLLAALLIGAATVPALAADNELTAEEKAAG